MPRTIDPTVARSILDSFQQGKRPKDIASEYGVSVQTVYTHLHKAELKPRRPRTSPKRQRELMDRGQ